MRSRATGVPIRRRHRRPSVRLVAPHDPWMSLGVLRGMDAAGIAKAVAGAGFHGLRTRQSICCRGRAGASGPIRRRLLDRCPGILTPLSRSISWQAAGLVGLPALFTTGSTIGPADWLGHEDSSDAWAHAEATEYSHRPADDNGRASDLRRLLERFPKVRVLLDHCARPDLSDGAPYHAAAPLFDMASFSGVYLKLTNRTLAGAASGKSQPAQFLQKLVAVFGANRIAWGSNFPAAEGSLRELLTSAQSGLSLLSPAGSGPDLQWNRANCLPRTRGAPAMSGRTTLRTVLAAPSMAQPLRQGIISSPRVHLDSSTCNSCTTPSRP